MNNKIIGSIEDSPLVNIAALIIIIAGVIYAKSIITPFLLALFISIICAQPDFLAGKKENPQMACTYHCNIGIDCTFFRICFPDRRNIIILFKQCFKI